MFRTTVKRFISGFCCSVAITLLIHVLLSRLFGISILMPEYAERFRSELDAYSAELLLIGVMSAVTSAGTIVFDFKKTGLVWQSVLFLAVMLSAWIPVACRVWGFHKYAGSMLSTIASIVVTYGICIGLKIRACRKDIAEINRKLKSKAE